MPTYQALTLSVISMLAAGITWFVAIKPIRQMGNLKALFFFQLAGTPLFLLFIPFMPKTSAPLSLDMVFLVGAFEAVVLLFFFHANKIGEAAIVNPIGRAAVLVTTLLGILFLHEIPSTFGFIGLAVVLTGTVLLSINFKQLRHAKSIQVFTGVPHALIFALGDGAFFFWVSILSRSNGWFYTTLGIRLAIAIVVLAILVFKREAADLFKNVPWKWMLPAAFGDVIAASFYNIAVSSYPVAYVTIITSSSVLITVILAVIFLKEKMQRYQIAGLALVVTGLIILQL